MWLRSVTYLARSATAVILLASVDVKVVQALLGYSPSAITRDSYTTVVPKLAAKAGENTAAMVRRRPVQVTTGTDGLPRPSNGTGGSRCVREPPGSAWWAARDSNPEPEE
jgi:hypothetical protein